MNQLPLFSIGVVCTVVNCQRQSTARVTYGHDVRNAIPVCAGCSASFVAMGWQAVTT